MFPKAEAEIGDEQGDTTAMNEDINFVSDHFQPKNKVDLSKLNVENEEDEENRPRRAIRGYLSSKTVA